MPHADVVTEQQTEAEATVRSPAVAIVIFGVLIAVVASKQKNDPFALTPQIQSATTMGHVSLGVLIFGLALLLCGVVVAAIKR